jgi:hypothetical protein
LTLSAAALAGCEPSPIVQAPVLAATALASPRPEPTRGVAPPPAAPDPPTASRDCKDVVTKAFPEPSGYPGTKRAVFAEVASCCKEVLSKDFRIPQRWDCCANLTGDPMGIACTPWGPPLPPRHTSSRRRAASHGRMATLSLRRAARRVAPVVPHLPHLRRAAIATWRARMVNEHGSASVFEGLARQMAQANLPQHVEASRFADEERAHGVLCGAVVEALGGEAIATRPARGRYPSHPDAKPLEGVLRNLLSICCLSETVAVALIGAERLEMPPGELRDLLTRIYAEEVGHARFGWRMLEELAPAIDAGTRERLGAYLAVAFRHLEQHELAHLPVASEPPPEAAAVGLCNGREARRLFFDTVAEVIIPGLERHGLPARRAWEERDLDCSSVDRLAMARSYTPRRSAPAP